MPRQRPKLIIALKRVGVARQIIANQHVLIANLSAARQSTVTAETALQIYLSALKHIEDHEQKLARNVAARNMKPKRTSIDLVRHNSNPATWFFKTSHLAWKPASARPRKSTDLVAVTIASPILRLVLRPSAGGLAHIAEAYFTGDCHGQSKETCSDAREEFATWQGNCKARVEEGGKVFNTH